MCQCWLSLSIKLLKLDSVDVIRIIDGLVRAILAELTHRLSMAMPIYFALFGS